MPGTNKAGLRHGTFGSCYVCESLATVDITSINLIKSVMATRLRALLVEKALL